MPPPSRSKRLASKKIAQCSPRRPSVVAAHALAIVARQLRLNELHLPLPGLLHAKDVRAAARRASRRAGLRTGQPCRLQSGPPSVPTRMFQVRTRMAAGSDFGGGLGPPGLKADQVMTQPGGEPGGEEAPGRRLTRWRDGPPPTQPSIGVFRRRPIASQAKAAKIAPKAHPDRQKAGGRRRTTPTRPRPR